MGQDLGGIIRRDSAACDGRQSPAFADQGDFTYICRMPGAQAGCDGDIGLEERHITGLFDDTAVGHDRVSPVFHMNVRQDRDIIAVNQRSIAQCFGRGTFDQPLVGDVGIRPLIDPDEPGSGCLGAGQRCLRCIGDNVETHR